MNMNEYYEIQRFNALWVFLILLIVFSACITPIYLDVFSDKPQAPISVIILLVIIPSFIIWIFITGYLKFHINQSFIKIEMRILIKFGKVIYWNEIDSVKVDKYRPIMEFGGWGYRIGINAIAYSCKGNHALIVKLKNNRRIVIGTQKPDDLRIYLNDKFRNKF